MNVECYSKTSVEVIADMFRVSLSFAATRPKDRCVGNCGVNRLIESPSRGPGKAPTDSRGWPCIRPGFRRPDPWSTEPVGETIDRRQGGCAPLELKRPRCGDAAGSFGTCMTFRYAQFSKTY